jgi:hypothetical protein
MSTFVVTAMANSSGKQYFTDSEMCELIANDDFNIDVDVVVG